MTSYTFLLTLLSLATLISSEGPAPAAPAPAAKGAEEKLTAECKSICDIPNSNSFCTDTKNSDPDAICKAMAQKAGGVDPLCEAVNGCSFTVKIEGRDKNLYVSHDKQACGEGNGEVYKRCANGNILYSIYAAAAPTTKA